MIPNRLEQRFQDLRRQGRKALIGYITAGSPDKRSLPLLIALLEQAGLDILELGIPFSDPIADGPTIQKSSQQALKAGATLPWAFRTVAALRTHIRMPLIFMIYSNSIVAMGIDRFFDRARTCGVDGIIIPDMIPEESARFERAARKRNVALIYLVAPTTSADRMIAIGRRTQGFLYAVSLMGVTGARKALSADLPQFLKKVKSTSRMPVAVGFGISTPEQARQASRYADGVIVGSALVKEVEASKKNGFLKAVRFVRSLKRALNGKESNHAS